VRASFLISDTDEEVSEAPDWAWSSNVRHHISLKQKQIVVSSSSGLRETFERRSVESKLSEFLRYLEIDSDKPIAVGAIDHLVRTFRKHRATLRSTVYPRLPELESFLYLLALTQEKDAIAAHRDGNTISANYALGNFDPSMLDDDYVRRFVDEVSMNSTSMRRLFTPLTIRHAGGALFQEAHAEILAEPVQMTLFGLADAGQQRLDLSLGAYYTPAGLARTLTEIAIEPHLLRKTISLQDPACGSGIFLCEAIRVLQRRNYTGSVEIIGRDISPSAVQMARFCVACALLDWPNHKVKWNVEVDSFLESSNHTKHFNILLMNPPFLSWEALSNEQKSAVRKILGSTFAGRPDLSTAFIQKALGQLSDGGTLATLVPRGVLDSQKGAAWRDAILSDNNVRMIGTFADHGLFRHAMVSIGAAVFEHKKNAASASSNHGTIMVWADERPNSAEGALRGLRRRSSTNSVEERTRNWSIYSVRPQELCERKSWLPTPNALGSLIDVIEGRNFRRLKEVFRVRQGIKTGLNNAFLISDDDLRQLPSRERRFFRRVANGEDIWGAKVNSTMNIFYVPDTFDSKKQLLEALPVFGRKLSKYEPELKRRPKSNPLRWWEPLWPRKDLAERTPRIMTKMFGASDMAAVDTKGEFLPLQAYAWMPHWSEFNFDYELREAALWWYCRLLNSRIFFLLRREFSAITAGGQLDVSPKNVNDVPLPSPTYDELIRLASQGEPNQLASKQNDELVAQAYGTDLKAWPMYAAD